MSQAASELPRPLAQPADAAPEPVIESNTKTQDEKGGTKEAKPLEVFTLKSVVRVITVTLHWPALYPNHASWVFKFRLALSDAMQKKREEWIALPVGQSSEKGRYREEALDEVCDLLTDLPEGFGDIRSAEYGSAGQDPGSVFRNYVNRAAMQDPETKETIYRIVEAANNGYYAKVSPREFPA